MYACAWVGFVVSVPICADLKKWKKDHIVVEKYKSLLNV